MRRVTLAILLVVLLGGAGALLIHLLSEREGRAATPTAEEPEFSWTEFTVRRGTLVLTLAAKGQVISGTPEEYLENYEVLVPAGVAFEARATQGQDVSPEDALYTVGRHSQKITYEGTVVRVETVAEGRNERHLFTVLNYDKLFVDVSIPADRIDEVDYDTPVRVTVRGAEVDAWVEQLGFEISEDSLPVALGFDARLLPGTPVEVEFTVDEAAESLYLSRDALYFDGEDYFADVRNASTGDVDRVPVGIGQEFTEVEDGNEFTYVQITSGLAEGDTVVVKTMPATVDAQGSDAGG